MKEIMTNAENRKNVVKALADYLGERAVYAGPPSFAYQVGNITVDRDGKVILEDENQTEEIIAMLTEHGFLGNHEEAEDSCTAIQIPIGALEAQGIINLLNMLYAKQYLINKAIGQEGFSVSENLIKDLEAGTFQNAGEVIAFIVSHEGNNTGFSFSEDTVIFTGFPYTEDATAAKAYAELASKMVQSAGKQKRFNLKQTIEENEKYYMRAWLVRIGLGGKDVKEERAFLLNRLKGHTAFRTPADAEKWKARRKVAMETAREASAETSEEEEGCSE